MSHLTTKQTDAGIIHMDGGYRDLIGIMFV